MKHLKNILQASIIFFLISGCGIHSAYVSNVNNNSAVVNLSMKNFEVIERVSGSSTATYFLGIGGITNKALIENAKSQMLKHAFMAGKARAIINVTQENHVTFIFPFFVQKTVTVSAHIIEFTN
jgi:hypothetical protein